MDSVYIVRKTPDGRSELVATARLDEIKQTIDELKQQPKYQGSHWWIETAGGRCKLRWDDDSDNRLLPIDPGKLDLLIP